MDKYSPKPGDTIPNWNQPIEPYVCTEKGPTYGGKSGGSQEVKANWDEPVSPRTYTDRASDDMPGGDNPGNYSMPPFANGTDHRNRTGGSNSNPTPGKVGA